MKTINVVLICLTILCAEWIYFHAWDHGLHIKSDGGLFAWSYNFETNDKVPPELMKQHTDNLSKMVEVALVEAKKPSPTPSPQPTAELTPVAAMTPNPAIVNP